MCVCVCLQEAMWNEDQVETKCSLLENDMEDLTEEVKGSLKYAVCVDISAMKGVYDTW